MMPESMKLNLRKRLVKDEGYENFPYIDTLGNITIGIGYNLSARGLPDTFINAQYEDDVQFFYNALNERFDWFKELSEPRQIVLVDMCFMGFKKFCGFNRMLAALSKFNYYTAANELLDSAWARTVGNRAVELSRIMKTGELC